MSLDTENMRKTQFKISIIALLVMLLQPLAGFAITKQNADDSYHQGNYQQAISDYKELLGKGVSPALYYNLGNAYYRSDSLSKAILCYERAYKLSPSDKDIRFNLQFARSKTIDKIAPEDDNFFTLVYQSIVNFLNVDTWAVVGIWSIVVALVLMLCYLFASPLWLRKTGFFGSVAFLFVFIFSTLFAWQQKYWFDNSHGAIVMSPAIGVKSAPEDKSPDAYVIHEGTRVNILDDDIKGWKQIQLGDGREGWIKSGVIEMI